MCHEGWARRRREQEEARKLWDLFNRETAQPREPREADIRLEQEKSEAVEEREPASVDR